ncbi:ABC transporter ATP-binding protein [Candidatus Gottesmanbacteria bacterium]|nr:ABC transporter ATP-binding protein [Candidatus Gottesmanbacteria bacterium]
MSLKIKNLSVSLGEKQILKDISLEIKPGTIHAIMGPNGSGKSTLAQALMGNPNYKIQNPKSKIQINNKNIINYGPDERAREGLFLAFQNPTAIPGVSVANLLKTAYQLVKSKNKESRHKVGIRDAVNAHSSQTASGHNPALSVWQFNEMLVEKAKKLGIPQEFLRRSLNEAFSGGEKKKLEMLQALVLEPKYAIFDEIDTGLDVDALKIVAKAIDELKKTGCGVVVITHYQRILKFAKPDFVHILVKGKIVASDGGKLAQTVEKSGYKKWSEN